VNGVSDWDAGDKQSVNAYPKKVVRTMGERYISNWIQLSEADRIDI